MATASIASQLQFDYLGNPKWALQGFEVLEREAFLEEEETQMESGNSNYSIVEKTKLVGTLLNLYQTTETQQQQLVTQSQNSQQQLSNSTLGYAAPLNPTRIGQHQSNDFGQYMEYVDSPPDSKEAWPNEYMKSDLQVPAKMVGIDGENRNTSGPNSPANIEMSKKRRMNWDETDGNAVAATNCNQQASQGLVKDHLQIDRRKLARYSGAGGGPGDGDAQSTGVVLPTNSGNAPNQPQTTGGNAPNANHNNNGGGGNAGGAWGDDIDFDLNNDLSSNGYMNDALFYHSLGGFKQEVPSPTQDKTLIPKQHQQQTNANAASDMLGKRSHALMSDNTGAVAVEIPQQSNGPTDLINSLQNNQQICQIAQQATNVVSNGTGAGAVVGTVPNNHLGSDTVVNFQQMLQENNSYEKMNGGTAGRVMTPPQLEKSPIVIGCNNSDDIRFQYVLAASTSIATKNNEDTLTYLNQGQSYEIKLKKLGDLTSYRNKILKSVIKICFYERRLQYMEREQMQQWQSARPGERILEIDVPLSFGCHPSQSASPSQLNTVEVMWDPMKEVGVYIKVNCISTEFTPKKHGGEKGVPFRIQVETYLDNKPVHGAMCQIKVFKLKGADRKHKQDREKIQKRPVTEQEKFQPSYECTILNDIPRDQLQPQPPCVNSAAMSPSEHIPSTMHSPPTTNGNKFEAAGLQFVYTSNSNSSSSNSLGALNRQGSTSNPNLCKTLELIPSPPAALPAKDFYDMQQNIQVSKDTTPQHLTQWINYHRLSSHMSTFAHFSGADLLRLTKDDLIQICGLADGIRMYNILHKKAITPRLTIFVSFDGACYHALYLHSNKLRELREKTQNLPGFRQYYAKKQPKSEGQNNGNGFMWEMQQGGKLSDDDMDHEFDMLLHLPSGIHVMMTEDVISHMKDESSYLIVIESRHVILRPIVKD